MKSVSIVAIDGPAASGKSTIGKALAEWLGFLFFDTGLMYRALTWVAIQKNLPINDEKLLADLALKVQIDIRPPSVEDGRHCDVIIDGQDVTWEIRHPDVDSYVSLVSMHPMVRQAMSLQQRRIGLRGNIVMVGRDIGTVVLPEADLKIYLEASVEERARRRFNELQRRGEKIDYETILESMKNRDQIDSTREIAPLTPAPDAIVVNTDGLNIYQVVDYLKKIIEKNFNSKAGISK